MHPQHAARHRCSWIQETALCLKAESDRGIQASGVAIICHKPRLKRFSQKRSRTTRIREAKRLMRFSFMEGQNSRTKNGKDLAKRLERLRKSSELQFEEPTTFAYFAAIAIYRSCAG